MAVVDSFTQSRTRRMGVPYSMKRKQQIRVTTKPGTKKLL
jgi:hypothetical protein